MWNTAKHLWRSIATHHLQIFFVFSYTAHIFFVCGLVQWDGSYVEAHVNTYSVTKQLATSRTWHLGVGSLFLFKYANTVFLLTSKNDTLFCLFAVWYAVHVFTTTTSSIWVIQQNFLIQQISTSCIIIILLNYFWHLNLNFLFLGVFSGFNYRINCTEVGPRSC